MKAILLICTLVIFTQANILNPNPPIQLPVEENNNCLPIFILIAIEVPKLITNLKAHDFNKAEVIFESLLQKLAEAYKCLNSYRGYGLLDGISRYAEGLTDSRRDCIVRHLRLAVEKFKEAMKALIRDRIEEFKEHLQEIVAILKEAKERC